MACTLCTENWKVASLATPWQLVRIPWLPSESPASNTGSASANSHWASHTPCLRRNIKCKLISKLRLKMAQYILNRLRYFSGIALWDKPCWKVEIWGTFQDVSFRPHFYESQLFQTNNLRLSSVQFHSWNIFRTSWTQPTTEEEFAIESVSIAARMWLKFWGPVECSS